jgi:2'-5' RNA ligase
VRLFVALWPPPDVITELDELSRRLRATPPEPPVDHGAPSPALRWATPERWHLTVAFLGEVADSQLPELQRRLARVSTRHPPLTLQFGGAGRFGDRVLFTKVTGDREPLQHLAASTAAAARRCGLSIEERRYHPHLTLARARPGTRLRSLVEAVQDYRGTAWTASALVLVRSRLGTGPAGTATYQTLASWPLTGRRQTG